MGIKIGSSPDISQVDIIVDALIGYGLIGTPRPEASKWIEKINSAGKPVLALDAPSGLDTTSGEGGQSIVRADATMTLALPKVGLLNEESRPYVGKLYLADISVPPELYRKMGLGVQNPFEKDPIIKIRE